MKKTKIMIRQKYYNPCYEPISDRNLNHLHLSCPVSAQTFPKCAVECGKPDRDNTLEWILIKDR